jgi:succinoglycan biosynthesis transport protein ExoP
MDRLSSPMEPLPRYAPLIEEAPAPAWHRSIRARVFGIAFIATLVLGAGWTLLQPVTYRSSATVLMTAPSAIDASAAESNAQDVAIQSRVLLGGDVTAGLLEALGTRADSAMDLRYLRDTLRVDAVPDTNLVEMVAEGSDDELLPDLVNNWIDVYLGIRAGDVQQNQTQTLDVVQDQLSGLSSKLDAAREALDTYRKENNISSVERQQNEDLAQLDGLNSALNTAVKNEVKAKAKLRSFQQAIAAGKNVVGPADRKDVESMEKELAQLEAQMIKLKKTFTENYIRNQPGTREIPSRIAELEEELAGKLAKAQNLALEQAEQEHAAALQTVEDLEEKLAVQKEKAARFTTIYTKHEALAKDLEELETLYRETQSRLVQVEVNQVEKHPQVSVIDRPDPVAERVGPDYPLLLGGSLGAALGMGILSVWLYGFLGPRPAKPAYVTLSGVHMYPQDLQHQLAHSAADQQRIGNAAGHRLERRRAPEQRDEEPPAGLDETAPDAPQDKS